MKGVPLLKKKVVYEKVRGWTARLHKTLPSASDPHLELINFLSLG